MAYTKNNWARGDVITSAKLNNIETGIANIASTTDTINDAVNTISTKIDNITTSIEAIGAATTTNGDAVTTLNTTVDNISSSLTSLNEGVNGLNAAVTAGDSKADVKIGILESTIQLLTEKLAKLSKTNVDKVETLTANYTDTEKDFVGEGVAIPAGKLDVTAKTIELVGGTAESAHVGLKATDDVVLTGVVTSGNLAKNVSNAGWSINTDETVTIKDCDFSQTGYNSVEIGLNNTAPKNVLIENCRFGNTSNNSILVFATADNATITIRNCSFGRVSQVLRLSNRTNATGVVVNLINCTIEATDSDLQWPMILCQDYMADTGANIKAANRFAPEKITINIINCEKAGQVITAPASMAEVCASGDEKGLIVVYNNYENATAANAAAAAIVAYDATRYPTLNVL